MPRAEQKSVWERKVIILKSDFSLPVSSVEFTNVKSKSDLFFRALLLVPFWTTAESSEQVRSAVSISRWRRVVPTLHPRAVNRRSKLARPPVHRCWCTGGLGWHNSLPQHSDILGERKQVCQFCWVWNSALHSSLWDCTDCSEAGHSSLSSCITPDEGNAPLTHSFATPQCWWTYWERGWTWSTSKWILPNQSPAQISRGEQAHCWNGKLWVTWRNEWAGFPETTDTI